MTPDKVNPPPEGGWESLKVDELKAELEARGLPKSGKKDELIARLADDDVAQAGTTPEAEAATTPEVQEVIEETAAAADASEEAAEETPKPARRRGSAETGTRTRRAS